MKQIWKKKHIPFYVYNIAYFRNFNKSLWKIFCEFLCLSRSRTNVIIYARFCDTNNVKNIDHCHWDYQVSTVL